MLNKSIRKIIDISINSLSYKDLYYVIESKNWSIKHDGDSITRNLKKIRSRTTKTRYGIRNSIIHFGSIGTFFGKHELRQPHKSNKIVVTWFHINPANVLTLPTPKAINHVDLWHTSCSLTRNQMVELCVPEEKIVVIPLGVNLQAFCMPSPIERALLHRKLNIPEGKVIIGSFLKDGNGWGEGLEPKLIKGPDIFCDAVERIAQKFDIFVLLTGPARGYVKKRLEKARIPYIHHFLRHPDDVAEYYKATDLCIVPSRVEGGPKSILESLASGVPIVTTRVGMVPDIICHGENGFIVEVEDTDSIVEHALWLINDEELSTKFRFNGIKTVSSYDWKNIACLYYQKLYSKFI